MHFFRSDATETTNSAPIKEVRPPFQLFITGLTLEINSLLDPAGWGKIKHPGSAHHTLQQAKLPPVSNDECAKKLAASPGNILAMLQPYKYITTIEIKFIQFV